MALTCFSWYLLKSHPTATRGYFVCKHNYHVTFRFTVQFWSRFHLCLLVVVVLIFSKKLHTVIITMYSVQLNYMVKSSFYGIFHFMSAWDSPILYCLLNEWLYRISCTILYYSKTHHENNVLPGKKKRKAMLEIINL